MKRAFVLSGGGAAGSWQFGVIKALHDRGIKPDVVFANSAGSLNAAGLCFGSIFELESAWRSIKKREDVFANRFFAPALIAFKKTTHLWDSTPLRKLIAKMVDGRIAKTPTFVNYVDLRDGKLYKKLLEGKGDDIDYIVASASIPGITQPVRGFMVDGGVRENTPFQAAIEEEDVDEIYVIFCHPQKNTKVRQPPKDIFEVISLSAQYAIDEAHRNDLSVCISSCKANGAKVVYIEPEKEIIGTLDFDGNKIVDAMAHGYLTGLTVKTN